MKRLLPFAIIVVVLVGAVAAAWYMKRAAQTTSATANTSSVPSSAPGTSNPSVPPAAPVSAVSGAEPAHFRGGANAAVTLEEFGDFECPPCGLFYPILRGVEAQYGDRIKVIFREFPLTPPHVHALAAARAAEAAGLQGKFFEMHDLLYENQKNWKDVFDVRPIFEEYAHRIGLDVAKWKADQDGEIVARRITLDGSRGHSLGLKGTPTLYLNGTEIPFEEFMKPEGLRAVIDKALSAGR
jgi:protein-disulfide isomerase